MDDTFNMLVAAGQGYGQGRLQRQEQRLALGQQAWQRGFAEQQAARQYELGQAELGERRAEREAKWDFAWEELRQGMEMNWQKLFQQDYWANEQLNLDWFQAGTQADLVQERIAGMRAETDALEQDTDQKRRLFGLRQSSMRLANEHLQITCGIAQLDKQIRTAEAEAMPELMAARTRAESAKAAYEEEGLRILEIIGEPRARAELEGVWKRNELLARQSGYVEAQTETEQALREPRVGLAIAQSGQAQAAEEYTRTQTRALAQQIDLTRAGWPATQAKMDLDLRTSEELLRKAREGTEEFPMAAGLQSLVNLQGYMTALMENLMDPMKASVIDEETKQQVMGRLDEMKAMEGMLLSKIRGGLGGEVPIRSAHPSSGFKAGDVVTDGTSVFEVRQGGPQNTLYLYDPKTQDQEVPHPARWQQLRLATKKQIEGARSRSGGISKPVPVRPAGSSF